MRDVSDLRQGSVTVAALPSLAATAVPSAFARFAERHPDVRLKVLDTLSGPAFDLVRAGKVDFALTAANPEYADLDYTPLMADRFVLLVPASHALARTRAPLRWLDTTSLAHISMPLLTSVRQYADSALLQHGVRFEPRYEVEHLATINAMVRSGLGVAALPELAAVVARGADVVQRPLVAPKMLRPIGLVTRHGRTPSPAAAAMVTLVREEMRRLVPGKPASASRARSMRPRPAPSALPIGTEGE
jgi:LysR family carnitine catabolism transcriptional activator